MSRIDAAELDPAPNDGSAIATSAGRALAHEQAGRFRDAWREWEGLRIRNPARSDWNAPLAASYLRFAFGWTADGAEGSLREAEEALVRGVAILTIDVAGNPDDLARLLLIARACEQRCILRAFGAGWTQAARAALDAGDAPDVLGDRRQICAAGAAATSALDLVAACAPSLTPLAGDLALSCLRLAATLEAAGSDVQAKALLMRAETVINGVRRAPDRPKLIALDGCLAGARTAPRRPKLALVTAPTG